MKPVLSGISVAGIFLCIFVFQNCGGFATVSRSELNSTDGVNGGFVAVQSMWLTDPGARECPAGYAPAAPSNVGMSEYICVKPHSTDDKTVVVDVQLTAEGLTCASDFQNVGTYQFGLHGLQLLCAKSAMVSSTHNFVTGLYSAAQEMGCTFPDTVAGVQGNGPFLCKRYQ